MSLWGQEWVDHRNPYFFQFTSNMLIPVTEEEMTNYIEDVVVPLGIVAHQVGIALPADNPVINAKKTLLATTDKQVCSKFTT